MKLGLDLVFFNFPDLWQEDRQAALEAVQLLLLDDTQCKARIEVLRRLETRTRRLPSNAGTQPIRDDFSREVGLLVEPGLFPAVEGGLITPERLSALTRDPDALWAAHQAATRFDGFHPSNGRSLDYESAETAGRRRDTETEAAGGAPQPGLSKLAHTGRWREFEAELRPWLPALLHYAGLPEDRADELMRFTMEQVPRMCVNRFTDLLPKLLEEFARRQGQAMGRSLHTDEDWCGFIEPSAFRLVLQEVTPQEPEWAAHFRNAAIRSRVNTVAALVSFEPADCAAAAEDVAAFRRDLLLEISRRKEEARRVFERE